MGICLDNSIKLHICCSSKDENLLNIKKSNDKIKIDFKYVVEKKTFSRSYQNMFKVLKKMLTRSEVMVVSSNLLLYQTLHAKINLESQISPTESSKTAYWLTL